MVAEPFPLWELNPDRLMDAELERMVLAQLLNAETIADGYARVMGVITTADFLRADHQILFAAINALGNQGTAATPLAVANELTRTEQVDAAFGPDDVRAVIAEVPRARAYRLLDDLAQTYPLCAGVEGTAREVLRLAYNRRMHTLLHGLQADILRDEPKRPPELAAHVLGAITALDPGTATEQPRWLHHYDQADDDDLERFLSDPRALPGYPSGLRSLDRRLGGWERSKTTIIAGRPGVGKSILGPRLAQGIAEQGVPVYYASLEMPLRALKRRLLWSRAGISPETLKEQATGATPSQREHIALAKEWVERLPMLIDDQTGNLWPVIQSHMAQAVARDAVKVCVIDHIDLVQHPKQERLNRHTQLSTIMNGLQAFGAKHDVCMIVLSQVNRSGAARDDGFPTLEDLRESGTKEEAADNVLFLSRPATGKEFTSLPLEQRHLFRVRIAKQRNGTTGDVALFVDPRCYRLEDRAVEYVQ